MKILHYFLGFPPYRTGGLTKYAFDLMKTQKEQGNQVIALWPGKMKIFSKKVGVCKKGAVDGIINYEMMNPLPVSLDEGIKEIAEFTRECDKNVFLQFLKEVKPEVIHIHTLMGLYKEFVIAANEMNIRVVFTTHDYFGICPKVTLYKQGEVCDNDHGCEDCVMCNQRALSLSKIKLMQSPMYRILKNSVIVKMLRKKHRNTFFAEESWAETKEDRTEIKKEAEQYRKLRQYYMEILEKIDFIHFNSSVTEQVYKRFLSPKDSKIVSITHCDIKDHRASETLESDILRLTCLAPAKPFKGYQVMKRALDELWESGNHNFQLRMYGPVQNPSEYMFIKEEGYQYQELEGILKETDVLLAPSIWYETFGFTVLEAISYGVPVIVSDHVGAKDIIGQGGMIVKAGSVESLKEAICSLSKEKINVMKQSIKEDIVLKTWEEFLDENYSLYKNR